MSAKYDPNGAYVNCSGWVRHPGNALKPRPHSTAFCLHTVWPQQSTSSRPQAPNELRSYKERCLTTAIVHTLKQALNWYIPSLVTHVMDLLGSFFERTAGAVFSGCLTAHVSFFTFLTVTTGSRVRGRLNFTEYWSCTSTTGG